MRDELSRVMDRMRVAVLESSCIVVQAVYRASALSKEYSAKCKASHELGAMIRGAQGFLQYLEQKWVKIDTDGRTALTNAVRATVARQSYYHSRITFFEGTNRQQ